MAGKATGAYSVLLTNGRPSVMLPGDPEPDWVIDHLSKLIEILG